MLDFLPIRIRAAINKINFEALYEIRLRAGRPVMVEYFQRKLYLCDGGIGADESRAINVSAQELKKIFFEMCERSVYAYTDKICSGFISLSGGIRVGICGECVTENGRIINIKDISSLNIRIPHSIAGCSEGILQLYKDGLKNVLIVSPPGAGKTTFVRDLAERLSSLYRYDVLVVDERKEVFPMMSSADTVDCITYSPKSFAFENGLRAMSPDLIVTDEIIGKDDANALLYAAESGVYIVATAHGNSIDIIEKKCANLGLTDVFDYYVLLSEEKGKGTLSAIYNGEFKSVRL